MMGLYVINRQLDEYYVVRKQKVVQNGTQPKHAQNIDNRPRKKVRSKIIVDKHVWLTLHNMDKFLHNREQTS